MTNDIRSPRKHRCTMPGCPAQAECIPALVVPASPLSKNKKFDGVRSVLWLPLCRRHFTPENLSNFIRQSDQEGMRRSIEMDFRHNEALADWNKAQFQQVPTQNPEYVHYEEQWFQITVEGRNVSGDSGSVH